jgi:hypothetical protein
MITQLARAAAFAALPVFAFVLGAGAGAQTAPPSPSPSPAPTPAGFSAHAHANLTVTAQGTTYAGSVDLGVAQRASLTRIDVLSLKSDSFPVPPITATAVIDRRANTVTVWSERTKLYHTQSFIPRAAASATPRPAATASATPARAAARSVSPFSSLDVLDVTLRLTGHTTTAGLPTTGLAFDLQVRKKGEQATSHVSATAQVADEYAAFPVTLDVSLEPGASAFGAKLSYAVDDLTRGLPPLSGFDVPAGYAEASSLLGVIFPRRSGTATPSPRASPRPRPASSP